MTEIATLTLDQMPRAGAISPEALTLVQEPGGAMQALDVSSLLGKLIATSVATATEADLLPLLNYPENATALVFADPTPLLSGWYRKSGASGSGSWSRFEILSSAARDAAIAAATLSMHYATDAGDVDVPGGAPGDRGARFWAGKTAALFTAAGASLPKPLDPSIGYAFAVTDASRRAAILVAIDGSTWITKFKAGTVTTAALADGGVTYAKLGPDLRSAVPSPIATESGFVFAVSDARHSYALAIRADGTVMLPKVQLGAGQVTLPMLAPGLAASLGKPLSAESGFLFAITDTLRRIGFGIKTDGSIVAKIAAVSGQFVTEATMVPALARQVVPHVTDVVEVAPDPWRARRADVAVRTGVEGTLWMAFPPSLTPSLWGLNGSGTSLDFRRASGLRFAGERYGGGFAPGAVGSVNPRGTFNFAAPTASNPQVGDYLEFTAQAPTTYGADTYVIGDLAVWNGSAWVRQAGPPIVGGSINYLLREPGDWWIAAAAGSFAGVSYAVGDRILHVGRIAGGGLDRAAWAKGDHAGRGEWFYRGEFSPANGLPNSGADGEVYQASAAGQAGGLTFAVGDYLVHEGGVWGLAAGEPIRSVAAGAFVSLPCRAGTAAEWEVRRTDKNPQRAGLAMGGRRQSNPRRSVDKLALFSDSMFGVSDVGNRILTKTGRTGQVYSYGGGRSYDILAGLVSVILGGDPWRGAVHGFWHGQNNIPNQLNSADTSMAMIKESAQRFAELIGARDRRCFFMSILGSRQSATWNGQRLVYPYLEDAFAGVGPIHELEAWYAQAYPGQWFNTRAAQLANAAASTLPDPTYPGMTEAQVAAQFGVIPFSFYNGSTTLPVPQASLHYLGTWSQDGAPSGGNANDYYIRTGGAGGIVGDLLINVAGAWVNWTWDTIHQSPAGADRLSTSVAAFITAANW